MKRLLLALLLLTGVCWAGSTFELCPDGNYVDEVHYEPELKLIVIHVHAKILWWTVNEYYGLKVEHDKDIDARMKEMLGTTPSIVHLKKL